MTQEEAIDLCIQIEMIAPDYNCHVALTGGCLYRSKVNRKDVDILFYRIRQKDKILRIPLLGALHRELGIHTKQICGWLVKAETEQGDAIDFMFPELPFGGYESE